MSGKEQAKASTPKSSFVPLMSQLSSCSLARCRIFNEFVDSHQKPLVLRSLPIQAKPTIDRPSDQYEQEADRIADLVMSIPELRVQRQAEREKEEEDEALRTRPLADQITPLNRKQVMPEKGEEGHIQRKQNGRQDLSGNIILTGKIRSLSSGGQPLPASIREFFEPRFGYDFSQVRVHNGSFAAELGRIMNAQAFTIGKDIVFGKSHSSIESPEERSLFAHELTHVIQQSQGKIQKINSKAMGGQLGIKNMDKNYSPKKVEVRCYKKESVQRQIARSKDISILIDVDASQTRPMSMDEYFNNYVGFNIESADYWLAPSSFAEKSSKLREFWVNFKDGRKLKFSLDQVLHRVSIRPMPGTIGAKIHIPEKVFIKRGGFIFPRFYNDATTPKLIDIATTIQLNQNNREKFREIAETSAIFSFILTAHVPLSMPTIGRYTKPFSGRWRHGMKIKSQFPKAKSYKPQSCFVAGTRVLTSEGRKPIEKLNVGDAVISFDPLSREISHQKIIHTFNQIVSVVLDIRIGSTVITCSPEHPFWIPNKGWQEAKMLEPGEYLLTRDDFLVRVNSIQYREGLHRVFNLEVDIPHTYYISDINILVHNKAMAIEPRPVGSLKKPSASWLKKQGIDPHTVKKGTKGDLFIDKKGNLFVKLKGATDSAAEWIGHIDDF
jgi:hypothetical protein